MGLTRIDVHELYRNLILINITVLIFEDQFLGLFFKSLIVGIKGVNLRFCTKKSYPTQFAINCLRLLLRFAIIV